MQSNNNQDAERAAAEQAERDKRAINAALCDQPTITLLSSTGDAAKQKRGK
jgi:hypothetical protein